MLALATVGPVLVVGCGRPKPLLSPASAPLLSHASAPAPATENPVVAFAQDPYMGVACHIPNSVACDRVGLAVWLRQPAIAVSATIAGAPLKLNDPQWSGPMRNGRRTRFAGFLQPAGLTSRLHVVAKSKSHVWLGNNAPTPLVRFRIDYGHGRTVATQADVWLSAGWG